MPCYTVWTAPISGAAIAPTFVNAVQAPGVAAALAAALGVAVSQVLPPDVLIQDVVAPAPRLPAELAERLYKVRQTSADRRLERGEREAELQRLLEDGKLVAEQRRELEELRRAEEEYAFRLKAAEGKRRWAADRLPWSPMYQVMAQSILEEVRKVDPEARLTRPRFDGDSGTSAIQSPRLGETRILLGADREGFEARVEGEVPPDMDRAMTVALARGFARLKVDARDLSIARLPSAPTTVSGAELAAVTQQAARTVIQAVPPTYVQVQL